MQLAQLRPLRERKALSIRALAAEAGVSPATVLRAEQGRAIYSVSVRKLAAALGVTPSDLRGHPPDPHPTRRPSVLRANALAQAERARARGDTEGVATFERLAAEIAQSADGVD